MTQIRYQVPLITQAANPICWLACVAMLLSYKRGRVVKIGEINGGFDPGNSSIPDPVKGWADFYKRLASFGITCLSEPMSPALAYLEKLLRIQGPFMLTHYAQGFPYGSQFGPIPDPNATHAVVITGMDTSDKTCFMNNPWGAHDMKIPANAVLKNMEQLWSKNIRAVSFVSLG